MNQNEYPCTVDYDAQFDLLSLTRPNLKSTHSIIAGPFTIDLHQKDLVGIEIENASPLLESLFGLQMDLTKITNARIGIKEINDVLMLFLAFHYEDHDLQQQIVVPKTGAAPLLA